MWRPNLEEEVREEGMEEGGPGDEGGDEEGGEEEAGVHGAQHRADLRPAGSLLGGQHCTLASARLKLAPFPRSDTRPAEMEEMPNNMGPMGL